MEQVRLVRLLPVLLVLLFAFAPTAAQPAPRMARVGMLCSVSCTGDYDDALSDELRKLGWIEGTTIVIERKEAGRRFDRLPELAADLVRSKPDLIVAVSPQPARAAKDATSEIPIVILFVADPVGVGLASSLAHPGGNLTGVATLVPGGFMESEIGGRSWCLPGNSRCKTSLEGLTKAPRASLLATALEALQPLSHEPARNQRGHTGQVAARMGKA